MSAKGADQIAAAEQFFRVLYGDEPPGYIAVWTLEDRKTIWIPARETRKVAQAVVDHAATRNVYFGVALHPKPLLSNARGKAESVSAIPGVWVEIDVQGQDHKSPDLPPSIDAIHSLVSEFPLRPTIVVGSGHGLHFYWGFRALWTFADENDRNRAQALVATFQAALQVKARTHGWRIDSTHDLARVLRPPGTVNRKSAPIPVILRELHDERRYDPSEFEERLIELPAPLMVLPSSTNGVAEAMTGLPLGRDALDFVTNGAPIGEQRARALKAARNYLQAGYSVDDTASALWRGFQASRQDDDREPWTYVDAVRIAEDLARSPAKPLKSSPSGIPSSGVHLNGHVGVHGSPKALLESTIKTFQKWLYLGDPGPIYVTLGTVAANLMAGDPVWLMIVGASSGGKTEIINALSRLNGAHLTATLTEAALLSGTPKREKSAEAKGGLLREMGSFGLLLVKDFTSILSMARDPRAALLAAIREIFDGRWTRHVGVDGGRTLSWEGKIGLVAGCTATIDSYHSVIATMGERFLLYRIGDIDPAEQAKQALANTGREGEMRAALAQAVTDLFQGLRLPDVPPNLDQEETTSLIALASLAARARSPVDRDAYTREIELIPDSEAPARIAQTLRRLYGGLRVIGLDRAQAWSYVRKVGLDCMPKVRRRVFDEVLASPKALTTSVIATAIGYPTVTTRRALEDLSVHGLVERGSGEPGRADYWQATPWTREQLTRSTTLSEMSVSDTSPLNTPDTSHDDFSDKVVV